MAVLEWDKLGEKFYEAGVDHGVLYVQDAKGEYPTGVVWNGLTTVTEAPSGAESNPQYADNIKYLNLISAEEFGGTIEAFTYPEEFGLCDGTAMPVRGLVIGQQRRRNFGFSYRTRIGNDVEGDQLGYKIHLVYGALAAPSEKAYATVNDSPEAITFSWEFTTTPVAVTNHTPTSLITIDSREFTEAQMDAIEGVLYGSDTVEARLPLPDEVISILQDAVATPGDTTPA